METCHTMSSIAHAVGYARAWKGDGDRTTEQWPCACIAVRIMQSNAREPVFSILGLMKSYMFVPEQSERGQGFSRHLPCADGTGCSVLWGPFFVSSGEGLGAWSSLPRVALVEAPGREALASAPVCVLQKFMGAQAHARPSESLPLRVSDS